MFSLDLLHETLSLNLIPEKPKSSSSNSMVALGKEGERWEASPVTSGVASAIFASDVVSDVGFASPSLDT